MLGQHLIFFVFNQIIVFRVRCCLVSHTRTRTTNVFQDLGGPMGMKPFDELGLQRIECHLAGDVCHARHEVL